MKEKNFKSFVDEHSEEHGAPQGNSFPDRIRFERYFPIIVMPLSTISTAAELKGSLKA